MNYKISISLLVLGGFGVSICSSEVVTELNNGAEHWYRPVSKEDLLSYMDDNPRVKQCARSIIERCYEREMRSLVTKDGKNKYGSEFPLYPEVMAPYLKTAKGMRVLEIAAGHGENGLLFALAGAKDVFINDIVQEQFIPLAKDVATLPESYQKRIHLLPGDCFDLMHNKELQQTCDLIIARNIVHFFTKEKRALFFTMVAKLLKPGGSIIISINTPFLPIPHELISQHPDVTEFHRITPMHFAPGQQRKPFTRGEFALANNPGDPLEYTFTPLITFGTAGIEKHSSLERFSPPAQEEILKYATQLIDMNGIFLLQAAGVILQCHSIYMLLYTKRTVSRLLDTTSLELVDGMYTDYDGHATMDESKSATLTVILKKKIEKACFTCGKTAGQKCSGCKTSFFCDRECQLAGWLQHKKQCK